MKFYRCPICGNILEKVVDGGGPLVCCGQPMIELEANTSDGATEKHVPAVTIENGVVHAVIGSVVHPSLEEHHINFIAIQMGTHFQRKDIKVGEKPEASFHLNGYEGPITVYEFCNLHGLWKTEI